MTFCHLVMDYVPDHFMGSHRFHFTVFLSFRLSVKQITIFFFADIGTPIFYKVKN